MYLYPCIDNQKCLDVFCYWSIHAPSILVFKSEELNWPVNSSPENRFMQLKESFLSSMCRHIPVLSDLISQIFWV